MSSLRITGTPATPIDLCVLVLAQRLIRAGGLLWIEVTAERRDTLRRELAFAGLGTVDDEPAGHEPDLAQAIGVALTPSAELSLDVLTLRPLGLAASTRRALGQRLPRLVPRIREQRHENCRRLLRGAEVEARWERRAWLPAALLRRRDARAALRPIVFDRAALSTSRPGGIVRASDGAITRWAFA